MAAVSGTSSQLSLTISYRDYIARWPLSRRVGDLVSARSDAPRTAGLDTRLTSPAGGDIPVPARGDRGADWWRDRELTAARPPGSARRGTLPARSPRVARSPQASCAVVGGDGPEVGVAAQTGPGLTGGRGGSQQPQAPYDPDVSGGCHGDTHTGDARLGASPVLSRSAIVTHCCNVAVAGSPSTSQLVSDPLAITDGNINPQCQKLPGEKHVFFISIHFYPINE